RRDAGKQVAEVVSELALVPLADVVDRGAAVLPEGDRPRTPEAEGVRAVDVDQIERIDHVAEALRDLLLVEEQKPVDEQLLRDVVAGRKEHRGPVHAVEAKNVLADHVPY